jgi:adenosylmethionine-8-amino-7-oxononanoate aminotransferase
MFPTREAPTPGCYRCPHNESKPVREEDARQTRTCKWQCVNDLERVLDQNASETAAFIMEPLVQGAAGMAMHPPGYLKKAAELCRNRGVWLMLDEVFVGFGRTGSLFAFQKENVQPDVIALAKGLTGGYLPMAATLASGEIFDSFLGDYAEFKTFFHGHSYSGNQLGAAAGLANLKLFAGGKLQQMTAEKSDRLRELSKIFWSHPNVGDIRQEGFICAIELVVDFPTRQPFPPSDRIGFRVCAAAQKHGLLTRPAGNVLLLMPPYCISDRQLETAVEALWKGLCEVLPPAKPVSVLSVNGELL